MNKVKLSRFVKDYENGPDSCMNCDEEWNGINYGQIWIGKDIDLKINLCDKCLRKIRKEIK